jgi:hypothetical protein
MEAIPSICGSDPFKWVAVRELVLTLLAGLRGHAIDSRELQGEIISVQIFLDVLVLLRGHADHIKAVLLSDFIILEADGVVEDVTRVYLGIECLGVVLCMIVFADSVRFDDPHVLLAGYGRAIESDSQDGARPDLRRDLHVSPEPVACLGAFGRGRGCAPGRGRGCAT